MPSQPRPDDEATLKALRLLQNTVLSGTWLVDTGDLAQRLAHQDSLPATMILECVRRKWISPLNDRPPLAAQGFIISDSVLTEPLSMPKSSTVSDKTEDQLVHDPFEYLNPQPRKLALWLLKQPQMRAKVVAIPREYFRTKSLVNEETRRTAVIRLQKQLATANSPEFELSLKEKGRIIQLSRFRK